MRCGGLFAFGFTQQRFLLIIVHTSRTYKVFLISVLHIPVSVQSLNRMQQLSQHRTQMYLIYFVGYVFRLSMSQHQASIQTHKRKTL